ncbi:MAG: 23S rRNA (adenine(1618)-N(6))-methyltransferase RlmF [Gammaproteobacteria bacterium]
MTTKKKKHPHIKSQLHPRNRHRNRYDFMKLIESCPELNEFVKLNTYKDLSIDFFNPEAVKLLNKALLKHYYDIDNWDIPKNYLCPPIPGRADYIHYVADLLSNSHRGKIPTGPTIKCLDIGVGANCVYPIIGRKEYDWSFIGTDIDPVAIQSANQIIKLNSVLKGHVEIRLQRNPKDIFQGIMQKNELIDITICNPPFHASEAEAVSGTLRKLTHLTQTKPNKLTLNFGGQQNELWCEGGEKEFVREMIRQSIQFADVCFWFSTLISKQENLESVYEALKKSNTVDVKTISMSQGNKISRIVAWTFLDRKQQDVWINTRW